MKIGFSLFVLVSVALSLVFVGNATPVPTKKSVTFGKRRHIPSAAPSIKKIGLKSSLRPSSSNPDAINSNWQGALSMFGIPTSSTKAAVSPTYEVKFPKIIGGNIDKARKNCDLLSWENYVAQLCAVLNGFSVNWNNNLDDLYQKIKVKNSNSLTQVLEALVKLKEKASNIKAFSKEIPGNILGARQQHYKYHSELNRKLYIQDLNQHRIKFIALLDDVTKFKKLCEKYEVNRKDRMLSDVFSVNNILIQIDEVTKYINE